VRVDKHGAKVGIVGEIGENRPGGGQKEAVFRAVIVKIFRNDWVDLVWTVLAEICNFYRLFGDAVLVFF
jgi:hypothetical protein